MSILDKKNRIKNQYEDLIERAREYYHENEFIMSVLDFYDEKGFITEKQANCLENWIENIEHEDADCGFDGDPFFWFRELDRKYRT